MPDLTEILPYGTVSDLHKDLSEKVPFFAQQSLPQFSQWANKQLGTQAFSQGLTDNKLRQLDWWIEKQLAPLKEPAGRAFGWLGEKIGGPMGEEIGRGVGEGLPRMLPEMALMGLGPVGIGLAAGDMALHAYGESGSPTAGVVSGVAGAAFPAFARGGRGLVAKGIQQLYKPLDVVGKAGEQLVGRTVPHAKPFVVPLGGQLERLAGAGGEAVGVIANQFLAQEATSLLTTGAPYEMNNQHLAELIAPQVAFSMLHLPGIVRGPKIVDAQGKRLQPRSDVEARAMRDISEAMEEIRNFVSQSQPAKVPAAPGVPVVNKPQDKVQIVDVEATVEDIIATGKAKAATLTAELGKMKAQSATLVALSRAKEPLDASKLDTATVEELVIQKVLERQPDGTVKVVGKIPFSDLDLINAALNMFSGKVESVQPAGVMASTNPPEGSLEPSAAVGDALYGPGYTTRIAGHDVVNAPGGSVETFPRPSANLAEWIARVKAAVAATPVPAPEPVAKKPVPEAMRKVLADIEMERKLKADDIFPVVEKQPNVMEAAYAWVVHNVGTPLKNLAARLEALDKKTRKSAAAATAAVGEKPITTDHPIFGAGQYSLEDLRKIKVDPNFSQVYVGQEPTNLVRDTVTQQYREATAADAAVAGYTPPKVTLELLHQRAAKVAGEQVVQPRHKVFGFGMFLRKDVKATTTRKINPTLSQVYVGGEPTNIVLRHQYGRFGPATEVEAKTPGFVKPKITADTLRQRAAAATGNKLQVIDHPVFGVGMYLLDDLHSVHIKPVTPQFSQVYVGESPTNMVLDTATKKFRVANEDEMRWPTFEKPVLTPEALHQRAIELQGKRELASGKQWEAYNKEVTRILAQYNQGKPAGEQIHTEAELRTAMTPKWREESANALTAPVGGAELMLQQVRPYIDAELLTLEQTGPVAELPITVRLNKVTEMTDVLIKALDKALTVFERRYDPLKKKAKDMPVGRHPLYTKLLSDEYSPFKHLEELMNVLPAAEAMDRVYRAAMYRLAQLTKAIEGLNVLAEQQLKLPKVSEADKVATMEKLRALEAQPHGPAVMAGLGEVLAGEVRYRGAKADVGLIDDDMYFSLLQRAAELEKPERWQNALHDYLVASRKEGETGPSIERAAAMRYIKQRVEEAPNEFWQLVARTVYLADLAAKHETELFGGELENMPNELNLNSLADFVSPDPAQAAKVDAARNWFLENFNSELTLEQWNAFGGRELRKTLKADVESTWAPHKIPAEEYARKAKVTPKEDLAKQQGVFNGLLSLMKSGELILRYTRDGLTVTEPENKLAALQRLGIETGKPGDTPEQIQTKADNNWKNVRNRYIEALTERMNAMFEDWLNKKNPNAELPVREPGPEASTAPRGWDVITGNATPGAPTQQQLDAGVQFAYDYLTNLKEAPVSNLELAIGAREWFRETFLKYGSDEATAGFYADVAAKVTFAFKDISNTKIMTLLQSDIAGELYSREVGGTTRAIVGMNQLHYARTHWAAKLVHTLGHELWHAVTRKADDIATSSIKFVLAARRANAHAAAMEPEQRGALLKLWFNSIFPNAVRNADPRLQRLIQHRVDVGKQDPNEFMSDIVGMASLGLASPSRVYIKDIYTFADQHTQDFLQGLYVALLDTADILAERIAATRPELAQDGVFVQRASEIRKNIKDVLASRDVIDAAYKQMVTLQASDPAAYLAARAHATGPMVNALSDIYKLILKNRGVPGAPSPSPSPSSLPGIKSAIEHAATWLGLKDDPKTEADYGIQIPWLFKKFMASAQLGQLYPILRAPFEVVRSFRPLANDFADRILKPMLVSTRLLKRDVLNVDGSGLKYVLTHPELTEAFNSVVLREQTARRAYSDDEWRRALTAQGITSPEAHAQAINFRHNMRAVVKDMFPMIVRSLKESAQHPVAQKLLTANPAMLVEDAKSVARQLNDATWAALSDDPTTAAAGAAQVMALRMSGVPGIQAAADALLAQHKPIREFEKRNAGNDWWVSEQRRGRYYVAYVDPKKKGTWEESGLAAFDTKQEASEWADKMSAKSGVARDKFNFWDKTLRGDERLALHPDFVRTLQEIETAAMQHKLLGSGLSQADLDKVFAYVPMEATLNDITSKGTEGFMSEKKSRVGRETINLARDFLWHVHAVATTLAKRQVTGEFAVALHDRELRANSEALKKAREHFANVINPPEGEMSLMKRILFSYYLGFNVSSMVVTATHPIITLMPQLTQDTGRLGLGYKLWGQAMHDLVNIALDKPLSNPTLMAALERARKEQRVDFGIMQEAHDTDNAATLGLRALMMGGDFTEAASNLGKRAINQYTMLARALYSQAPRLNSNVAFISAYRAATEHGVMVEGKLQKLTGEKAYQYAVRTVDSTMHSGGPSGRPVGMFSNLGQMHGIVGLAYSLGTYTMGTMGMMARLGLQAIKDGKYSPAEKAYARKAFMQMMFTQAAFAGALGMPFVAWTFTVLNQLDPHMEPRKAVEDGLKALAGDDDEMGNLIANVAMRGVVNQWTGLDLSSRMHMSQILGINGYDGLNVGDFIGPVGGIFDNIIKATQYATTERYGQAVQALVPNAYKHVIDLYRNDGVIRDETGKLLVTPATHEAALYALGFKPTILTNTREREKMIQLSEDSQKIKDEVFTRNMAKRVIAGDIQGVKEELINRQMETRNMYVAARGAEEVAEEVIKRTIPYNLARTGVRLAAAERRRLASSLPDRGVPSEVQRLMTKKSLGVQLGVPGASRIAPAEITHAALVDQLLQANPMLGYAEARQIANLMVGQMLPVLR